MTQIVNYEVFTAAPWLSLNLESNIAFDWNSRLTVLLAKLTTLIFEKKPIYEDPNAL